MKNLISNNFDQCVHREVPTGALHEVCMAPTPPPERPPNLLHSHEPAPSTPNPQPTPPTPRDGQGRQTVKHGLHSEMTELCLLQCRGVGPKPTHRCPGGGFPPQKANMSVHPEVPPGVLTQPPTPFPHSPVSVLVAVLAGFQFLDISEILCTSGGGIGRGPWPLCGGPDPQSHGPWARLVMSGAPPSHGRREGAVLVRAVALKRALPRFPSGSHPAPPNLSAPPAASAHSSSRTPGAGGGPTKERSIFQLRPLPPSLTHSLSCSVPPLLLLPPLPPFAPSLPPCLPPLLVPSSPSIRFRRPSFPH